MTGRVKFSRSHGRWATFIVLIIASLVSPFAVVLTMAPSTGVLATTAAPHETAGQTMAVAVEVADVRAKPDIKAELVTQAVLGTEVVVEKVVDEWAYIRIPPQWDYPGWISLNKLVQPLEASDGSKVDSGITVQSLSLPILGAPRAGAEPLVMAPLGSRLAKLGEADQNGFLAVRLPDGRNGWIPTVPETGDVLRNVVKTAHLFLGTPYLWGGMTYRGVDCSGLVYMAFYVNGITLHRDADLQFAHDGNIIPGATVKNISGWAHLGKSERVRTLSAALRPGDLVFFDTRGRGRASHVGIYAGDGVFLNASSSAGKVVRSRLDDPYWLDRYLGAKRIKVRAGSEKGVVTE